MKLFNAQCIEIILDQIAIVIFKDEYNRGGGACSKFGAQNLQFT